MPPATVRGPRTWSTSSSSAGCRAAGRPCSTSCIGQLPGHCDVGELFYLWQGGVKRDQRCSCGELFSECDFWNRVGERAFGGWDRVDVEEVLRLQAQVDSTARQLVGPLARLSRRRRERTERYLSLTRRGLPRPSPRSPARTSSSTRPSAPRPRRSWPATRVSGCGSCTWSATRAGCSTRGAARSPLPENSGPRAHLKKRPARQILRRWWTVNLMIDRLGRRGVPLLRLRYEDMVSDPREAMRAVMRLSGREAGDDDLVVHRARRRRPGREPHPDRWPGALQHRPDAAASRREVAHRAAPPRGNA